MIEAESQETKVWLGDEDGNLVQKETGMLDTSVMEGVYTVELGLGTATYPMYLTADAQYTEYRIKAGRSCLRPRPNIEPRTTGNSEFP